MIDITPRRNRESRRGGVITAQPWPEIVTYWAEFAKEMPKLEPLHQLVRTLVASPAASVLFGHFTLHGIVICNCSDFRSLDGALEIDFYAGANHFDFRHRAFSGHEDHKLCPAAGIETLRLFLRYKYGVLLEGLAR